jgi:hypothetical protein
LRAVEGGLLSRISGGVTAHSDAPLAVDGMFKIAYIFRAPVLGKSVPKAFPKHGLGKFLAQKIFFWG